MPEGDFLTVTLETHMPGVADAIAKEVFFLDELKRSGRIQYGKGGQSIKFMTRYLASGGAKPVSDHSVAKIVTTKTLLEVETLWRAYAFSLGISKFQKERNQNAGDAKLIDMVMYQLNEAQESFIETLGSHVYSDGTAVGDNGEAAMDGLTNIVDTDNTYCSLDRTSSTYAWWRAQTNAVSGDPLEDDDLDGVSNLLDALYDGYHNAMGGAVGVTAAGRKTAPTRKNMPDLILTTKAGYLNFVKSQVPQQRYVNGGVNDPSQKIKFAGLDVNWDTYCTSDTWRFLTTRWFEMWVVGKSLVEVEKLPSLGAGQPRMDAWDMTTQLQLFCRAPWYQSFVTGIGT